MKREIWILLPFVAVATDAVVIAIAFAGARGLPGLATATVLHAGAAAFYGWVLDQSLRRVGRKSDLFVFLLGATVAFFIPVFGGAALTVALLTVATARPKEDKNPVQYLTLRALVDRQPPTQIHRRRPADRLVHVVRSGRAVDDRFEAVLAAASATSATTIAVLRAALADASEEVRLSAFSKLETTTRDLEKRIEEERALLEGASKAQALVVHATLAQLYFQIAYLGLAEGEVFRHTLKTAATHAEEARKGTSDPQMLWLLGRIALLQATPTEHPEEAKGAFEEAVVEGIPGGAVLLDRADEAFRRRAFKEVRKVLSEGADLPHDDVVVRRIQEFWR